MPRYSPEPTDRQAFTRVSDAAYTRFARVYDVSVKLLPIWKRWLRRALPHVRGPRVLEVSFGTGFLLTQIAGAVEAHGLELNERMIAIARSNLRSTGKAAALARGSVEALPYKSATFDSLLCTMAFTGYPDGRTALSELVRVLRINGQIVMIDVNFPADGNRLGTVMTGAWKRFGDLIRDTSALFGEYPLDYTDEEIGGWGSVHLYVLTKQS